MLRDDQRDELEGWAAEVLPRAVAYARSFLRDGAAAEDVVQECLYRLLCKADDYDLLRDGVKLLFRAVSNRCINQASRRQALTSLDTGGADEGPLPVEDRLAELPPEALACRELQAAIEAALARLPELQRAALELRALGQGKAEIAEVLQVSESHAGVLVHRARRALAEELAPLR
jgi:RNA polymerase sigma factor (sigma-70 family)